MVRTASFALLAVALLTGSATATSAPAVQVYEGATLVSGAAPVSFGTADLATVKTKTFTLRNTGPTPITIDPLVHIPKGFTLARRPSFNVASGEATSLGIALNAAQAGYFAGPVFVNTSAGRVSFNLDGAALGRPSMRILDNTDAGFRTVGRWTTQTGPGLQGNAVAVAAGSGTQVAAWTFKGLIPGLYQVSATWTPGANRATNARFTLVQGRKSALVTVNQQLAPADFHDAGQPWQRLGQPFKINGNMLVVQLSDLANGAVVADAIRIERVGLTGQIATPNDPAFRATGTWARAKTGTAGLQAATGTATWTFQVRPGQYRVSASWHEGTHLAAHAQYTLLDGTTPLATVSVNQQRPPAHFRDAGNRWQDLAPEGGLYTVKSGRLTVTLSGSSAAAPGGARALFAGPIRIEQQNGPGVQTQADIIRFLEQATWGPTRELAAALEQVEDPLTYYLQYQYTVPTSGYATQPLYPQQIQNGCGQPVDAACSLHHYSMYIPQLTLFFNGMYGEDQLKQRMAWALHKIIVVGGTETDTQQASRVIPYLQILDQHALGNYRSLLQAITLNAAMGAYLDMKDSTRARPNENYGREMLQLFSVGVDLLNPDGTPVLDVQGNRIPTYDQAIVSAFTRVFTAWELAGGVSVPNYHDPMRIVGNTSAQTNHDWGQKNLFFGVTIPAQPNQAQQTMANAHTELSAALDNVFNHPNVGPFITKNLIQQFVTSNPSPAYVARAASWFEDNGAGRRGDLSAVLWAILMDPEARTSPEDPNYGKLREPVQYALSLLRAFSAYSRDGTWFSDGYVNPQSRNMGQNVFMPPSVFSYFPPNNTLPGFTDVLAPEFNIFDTALAIRRANFVNQMTFGGGIGVTPTYPYEAFAGTSLTLTPLEQMSGDPEAMADYLNDLLLHGEMPKPMRAYLIEAIAAVPANDPLKRARTAVYLVFTSSQYQVQR